MRTLISRSIVQAVFAAATLLPATVAHGVTAAAPVKDVESVASVTTSAAVRASADVQIRRIKNLMVSKIGDSETDLAMDRLKKLQKDLRGEK